MKSMFISLLIQNYNIIDVREPNELAVAAIKGALNSHIVFTVDFVRTPYRLSESPLEQCDDRALITWRYLWSLSSFYVSDKGLINIPLGDPNNWTDQAVGKHTI